MQKGWNIKYQKGSKSLCTLYPMKGYFILLVVIGKNKTNEAEMLMPTCSKYIQNIFNDTIEGYKGKWLMIEVKNKKIIKDVKELIFLRSKK